MYSIEECTLYKNSTIIYNIPIYVFEYHNMALPAWGTICNKIGKAVNLLTFDTHTDTYAPFNGFLFSKDENCESGLSNYYVKELLKKYRYSINDFSFEDLIILSGSYIKNMEHIKTAYEFGYLKSYTVIHKSTANDYEIYDRELGYDCDYQHYAHIEWEKLSLIEEPLIIDFDLDYFNSRNDFWGSFEENISPIIKRAVGITIATEPQWFKDCRCDDSFSNEEALNMLINLIDKSLSK